ncbi:hypothetical protein [Fredinandcohnia quinoae]|nr:hypothetical protein [Fredinandcohnia sp. SECRCQ15]
MTILSFKEPPMLEGERVKLLPLEFEHASNLFAINHQDIWAFMLL